MTWSNIPGKLFFIAMPLIALQLPAVTRSLAGGGPAATGHSYYINTGGDDSNDGSLRHPWKTLRSLDHRSLRGGDSIFFGSRQSFAGTLTIDSGQGGNAQHPLFISSYKEGGIKQGSDSVIEPAIIDGVDSPAIILYRTGYIQVENLRLTGKGRKTGNTKDGLMVIDAQHIILDSLDITGFQKSGLLIYSSTDITVRHVNAHENGAAGISVEATTKKGSRNIRILDCRAEDNPGDPANLTNHSGNGIVAGHCTNLLIDRCTASRNGWDMPRTGNGPVGIWCYEADSVIIQHCLSYRNATSAGGADGGGFDLDGGVTHSVLQFNLSFENEGSGYCLFQYPGASPWHDNIVRFNISENDGTVSGSRGGLYIWNGSGDAGQFHDCIVYNNTIWNSKEAALSYSEMSGRKAFAFYNNIFVAKDSLVRGDKGKDLFLGNDWWSLKKKFNADRNPDPASLAIDPSFKTPSVSAPGAVPTPESGRAAVSGVTDATALPMFDWYSVPPQSPLRDHGIDMHSVPGAKPGKVGFNGLPAPVKGIGANF
jgi:parallel beta helix pectate lyase-like protein